MGKRHLLCAIPVLNLGKDSQPPLQEAKDKKNDSIISFPIVFTGTVIPSPIEVGSYSLIIPLSQSC